MPEQLTEVEPLELPELQVEKFEDADPDGPEPELDIAPRDRRLVTHPYDFIIRSLRDQIDDNTLILADKFQRRRVWPEYKASGLIESLLLNVPIPVCYFAELDDGAYSVIDGQQRLTAIYRFLGNEFALRGLRIRTELNHLRYQQLDKRDQRLITSRAIRCIVILKDSHPAIRFDIFERLNTGATPLNRQELRNSMYRGALNDLIRHLSEDATFMNVRGVSGLDKRMRDCELILRFFAFHFRLHEYKGYFAGLLDNYLSDGMKFDATTLKTHESLFRRVIADVFFVFGSYAFRRYAAEGWEKTINRGPYDVVMLSFAKLESADVRSRKDQIIRSLQDLRDDTLFNEALTSSTTDKGPLQTRLDKWTLALRGAGLEIAPFKVGE